MKSFLMRNGNDGVTLLILMAKDPLFDTFFKGSKYSRLVNNYSSAYGAGFSRYVCAIHQKLHLL